MAGGQPPHQQRGASQPCGRLGDGFETISGLLRLLATAYSCLTKSSTIGSSKRRWEGTMTDIETRLKALEKHAQMDDQKWQAEQSYVKALSFIFDSIGEPLCAANPSILPLIIENLKSYLKRSRIRSESPAVIGQLRQTLEFFEKQAAKIEKSRLPSASSGVPRRKK
jgi:hypothetical protein